MITLCIYLGALDDDSARGSGHIFVRHDNTFNLGKHQDGSMKTFDFKSIPQHQLISFYGLTIAAAAADGSIDKEELIQIYETIDLSPLDDKGKETVFRFVAEPPGLKESLVAISTGSGELRFAVVVGIVEVLLADDIIVEEEQRFLDEACSTLQVKPAQRDAIINFVKEARRIIRDGLDDNSAEKVLKGAVSGLGAVGVPIAAVYFSGSVIGLSAAGITSGLAALGLGLGMVPGIGIAVIIGTGIFFGLKTLFGDSKEEKEKIRRLNKERKAQLVIKNLQETINALMDRMKGLEKSAQKAEANESAIEVLRERLLQLQRICHQRREIAA
jgi:hypothetical protein